MKIIFDQATLSESPKTLGEAIAAAAEHAAARQRVIVDIFADGRALSADELDDQAAMRLACDELRLTSAEPRAFVSVTMQDAADALAGARAGQLRAAELIEAGSPGEAFKALNGALDVWQAARQAFDQGAQLLGLDLTAIPLANPEVLPEAISKLSAALAEVRRAIAAEDWAGLSDVLRYDLADLLGEWQGLLRAVADHIVAS